MVDGVIKEPSSYEPFPAEDVGQKREILIGKHSGIKSIIFKFKKLGIFINEDQANFILAHIKISAESGKKIFSDNELCRSYGS